MEKLPPRPYDPHLELDWQYLREDQMRLYAWTAADLEWRQHACEEIVDRAGPGQEAIRDEAEGFAELWGVARRLLVVQGLQTSLDHVQAYWTDVTGGGNL